MIVCRHLSNLKSMPNVKITIATPTIRLEGARVLYSSLQKQNMQDFEWLISTPYEMLGVMSQAFPAATIYPDPPKRDYDITNVYKAHNMLARKAKGELVIACVDYTELSSNALEVLWKYYIQDNKSIYGLLGDFYSNYKTIFPDMSLNAEYQFTEFAFSNRCCHFGAAPHEIAPRKFDFAVASAAKQAYYDVGGIDEAYDKYTGNAEKDFTARLSKYGYKIMTCHEIIMKGYTAHGRLPEWKEDFWPLCCDKLTCDLAAVDNNTRLKLEYVK